MDQYDSTVIASEYVVVATLYNYTNNALSNIQLEQTLSTTLLSILLHLREARFPRRRLR
jgi:hypothetical protein